MKKKLRLFYLPAIIMNFTGLVKSEETAHHQIRMERPEKPGTKFDVTVTTSSVTVQQAIKDGVVLEGNRISFGGTLECTEEVMEVGENGEVKKSRFVVRKFTVSKTHGKNEATTEALAPGQVLIREMDGGSMQFTNHIEFGDSDSPRILGYMFQRRTYVTEMKEDVIFNTADKHAEGDEWNVSVKELKSGLPVGSLYEKIDEEQSGGKVRFEKQDTDDRKTEAAHISANFKMIAMGMKGMEDAEVQNASLEIGFKGHFPFDSHSPPLSIETEVRENFTFDMKEAGGEKRDIRNIREIVTRATRKLIK